MKWLKEVSALDEAAFSRSLLLALLLFSANVDKEIYMYKVGFYKIRDTAKYINLVSFEETIRRKVIFCVNIL